MKLALRYELPADASALHKTTGALIEGRLVSRFAHGGIVIGDRLYHSTGAEGVHSSPMPDLAGWLLVDLGDKHDARALALFYGDGAGHAGVDGSGYDFFSLGAFVVPPLRDSQRYYCFELCFLLMTCSNPIERTTPEVLLLIAFAMGGRLLTPLPAFKATPMEISYAAA